MATQYSSLRSLSAAVSWIFVCIAALLICVAAYKNISYPLLWNDESETAMTARQVLKYGYPKVHDGKHTIFIADNPLWLGYKKSYDANISIPWGNYYFGAIGVWLAGTTVDIYRQTALVRLPYTTIALIGLMMFGLAMRRFFTRSLSFRLFFAVFLLLEMLSVNMLVHIREARYYSLVIFICACYFYLFATFHFHRNYSKAKYLLLLSILLLLAYNVNAIAYGAMALTTGLYQIYAWCQYRFGRRNAVFRFDMKESIWLISPLIFTAILIIPELSFFETFRMAALANAYYHNSTGKMLMNLKEIFHVMCDFDLLYAFAIIWVIRVSCTLLIHRAAISGDERIIKLKGISLFMSLFFAVFILIAARMPFLFSRYFIVLQPVLILMLLTDMLIAIEYIKYLDRPRVLTAVGVLYSCICLVNIAAIDNHISDYLGQMFTPYRGPLDFYIPALQKRFPNPGGIVIATNYEELSFEYYLGCQVILGYKNQFQEYNEEELGKYSPDVLIIRPASAFDKRPYEYYMTHGRFQKVTFPVKDWPVNNMADLDLFVRHQFKTLATDIEDEKAKMYLRTSP